MTDEELKEFEELKKQLAEKENTIKSLQEDSKNINEKFTKLEEEFNKLKESSRDDSDDPMEKGAPFKAKDPDEEFAELMKQMFKE